MKLENNPTQIVCAQVEDLMKFENNPTQIVRAQIEDLMKLENKPTQIEDLIKLGARPNRKCNDVSCQLLLNV